MFAAIPLIGPLLATMLGATWMQPVLMVVQFVWKYRVWFSIGFLLLVVGGLWEWHKIDAASYATLQGKNKDLKISLDQSQAAIADLQRHNFLVESTLSVEREQAATVHTQVTIIKQGLAHVEGSVPDGFLDAFDKLRALDAAARAK